ncbi:hypothetical protein BJX62DRAFT_242836 [Aspergillus germanicus]
MSPPIRYTYYRKGSIAEEFDTNSEMDDDFPPLESDFETDVESEFDIILTPTSSTASLTTGEGSASSSSASTGPVQATDETPAVLQVQITLPPQAGRWILMRRQGIPGTDIQIRYTEDRKWMAFTLVWLWTGVAFLSYGVLVSVLVRGFKTYCGC